VEVDRSFTRPDDGGGKHSRNIGRFLSDYASQHPKDCHLHNRRLENLKSPRLLPSQKGLSSMGLLNPIDLGTPVDLCNGEVWCSL
jgi:hypothetical protein